MMHKQVAQSMAIRSRALLAVVTAACIYALLLVVASTRPLSAQQPSPIMGSDATWRFAVSGDSRNCGDIVMPAIAQGVLRDGASFYWHLGDYRAIFTFDE